MLPLSDVYLQIATPSSDDSYAGAYLTSFNNTKTTLEHFGGTCVWINYPGCSDLCHARNKILAKFIDHPQATHLLKVDNDISWSPNDVIRMINSKRDFIAGVAPKKTIPPEWCVGNYSDETGKLEPCAFKKTGEDIVAYVKAVGTGFVLITKLCAVRMRHEYKDLCYTDRHDGEIVHAVYDPVYVKRPDGVVDRHFDDFAFCYRWRKIGGVVAVFPDIYLTHKGTHTFEGKWMDDEDTKKQLMGMFNETIDKTPKYKNGDVVNLEYTDKQFHVYPLTASKAM